MIQGEGILFNLQFTCFGSDPDSFYYGLLKAALGHNTQALDREQPLKNYWCSKRGQAVKNMSVLAKSKTTLLKGQLIHKKMQMAELNNVIY